MTGTFDYGATIDVNASLNAISEDGVISYIVEDLANGSNAVFGYAEYDWNDIFLVYLPIELDNV